jgi:NAD(P)-dependent dehydrogenase (short-subunit alcohol dehydrogenase family)
VVNTSSIAHRSGKIDFDDINAENGYRAIPRYGMSKLANLLFTYELQQRLEAAGLATLAIACHPGVADTELTRYLPGALKITLPLVRPLFNTAASGAWPTLCAATSLDAENGDYFGPTKRRETAGPAVKVRSTRASHDQKVAKRLWDLSVAMTGVDPGI